MAGIVERIGSLAGTELAKAINLAHTFYNERMGAHGHTGRALVETVAEVARNHPNLVGIGVGLLVEQLLAEEKRRHDAYIANGGAEPHPDAHAPSQEAHPAPGGHDRHLHLPELHSPIRITALRPGRVAFEVFGAILLLKLASSGVKMFRHKNQHEVWFAPAARVRLWSATIATYYFVKSLRSPKISAWRNAAVALFGTDALKPVLRGPKPKKGKGAAPTVRAPAPALSAPAEPAAPDPVHDPFTPAAASFSPAADASAVSTVGRPKPDPRPMPVWPSEAKKAAQAVAHTPAPDPAPAPAPVGAPPPPPIEPHDGPFPPG